MKMERLKDVGMRSRLMKRRRSSRRYLLLKRAKRTTSGIQPKDSLQKAIKGRVFLRTSQRSRRS